jgi:endonuclease YncB( thermonuclease family)
VWRSAGIVGIGVSAILGYAVLAHDRVDTRIEAITGNTVRIGADPARLWGTLAPPVDAHCAGEGIPWSCGVEARAVLQKFVDQNRVECRVEPMPQVDGEQVARCDSARHGDVALWLIRNGWAADYFPESQGYYALAERDARQSRAGIWSDR